MNILFRVFFSMLLTCYVANVFAQQPGSNQKSIIQAAGTEYKRSPLYQYFWGHNYRNEWTTPVSFPMLMLDTAYGGLTPYKEGGGHQSKSLHLKTKEGKEYVIRSVDKNLKVIIPPIFYNTFVARLADDQISISHPYASLTVPLLADAAKIYHTNPTYVFVPRQPALDTFNEIYGNKLYLLEQRPDEDWSDAANLGNFKNFLSSDKVTEKMYEDNSHQADQQAFVKARLFDFFIGDWDRHEGQWKWGKTQAGGQTLYEPIPVDRDQPYARFDGVLLKTVLSAEAKYLQSFDYDIKYPEGYSFERKNLDRFFTNRVTLDQWQNIAKELQQQITDNDIEKAIKQLPNEIFALSGNDIIAQLKSRRTHLVEYAAKYYLFLAKEVSIVGSAKGEYFEVSRLNNNETQVNVYDQKDGEKRDTPYYSRTFHSNETKEIRLFGLSGKDVYKVNGDVSKGIRIRIIGGDKNDSISLTGHGKKVHIYDDHNENTFILQSKSRLHLSSDSTVHQFDYDAFRPDKKGLMPQAGYNDEDRIFVGIGYGWQHQSFRKTPFAFKQSIGVNYSISQSAFGAGYKGIFPGTFGRWNLLLNAGCDAVRWTYFYGIGNETPYSKKPVNYFRMRTAEWYGNIGLNRIFGKSNFTLSGFFNTVKILKDSNTFITKDYLSQYPEFFTVNRFAGGSVNYNITSINDSLVPIKGVVFNTNGSYTRNLRDAARSCFNFSGDVQFYIPLIPKISLAINSGAATVTGTPEFYQYPSLGGSATLRGYTRGRFRGKTAFYNSNEIRFITNIKTYLMNGKGGLVAFFDNGRVWMPGENANTWHTSYGGGILLAPFNLMFFDITYGISKESTQIQLRSTIRL